MDFKTSQTMYNLARSFAGESQARQRYQIYADKAKKEGQFYIANIFEMTAANEYSHAKVFLNNLVGHYGESLPNVNVNAGYPFELGNTTENLQFARDGEHNENTLIYPDFAKVAKEEGFEDISAIFTLIAKVEGDHSARFDSVYQRLSQNTLYKSTFPTVWKCSICGHTHTADTPWEICPVCGHPMGYVEFNV